MVLILLLTVSVFVGIPAWIACSIARHGKNERAVIAFLSTVLIPIAVWWMAQWLIDLMYATGYCRGSTTGLYNYCNGTWEPGLTPVADALYNWFPATATIASFVFLSVRWARTSELISTNGTSTRSRVETESDEGTVHIREHLRMLDQLHKDGVISDEEFKGKRAKLLKGEVGSTGR